MKEGINNLRSNEGLHTKWKSTLDPTTKLLYHYARMLENRDKGNFEILPFLGQFSLFFLEKDMKVKDPNNQTKMVF